MDEETRRKPPEMAQFGQLESIERATLKSRYQSALIRPSLAKPGVTQSGRGGVMSINTVQFQRGSSMTELIHCYGTEAKCYHAQYEWRWPQGLRCPACAGPARSRFKRGTTIYYQCRGRQIGAP